MQVFQKKNIKWVIVLICISIFVYLMQAVWGSHVLPIDTSVYNFITKHFISDTLTPIMRVITQFGGTILMIVWAIASLVLITNKRIAVSVVSNLVLIALLNNILKLIVRRARPTGFRLITETGYSFPSGHSMVSMVFDSQKCKKYEITLDFDDRFWSIDFHYWYESYLFRCSLYI